MTTTSSDLHRLITLLADGAPHPTRVLGAQLDRDDATVHNLVRMLSDLEIRVYTIDRDGDVEGYQIPGGLDLLDEGKIRAALHPLEAHTLRGLEIVHSIDSTNRCLIDYAHSGVRGPYACLAEYQTMGRGRRGNRWLSPFASGLCLSVLWTAERNPSDLAGLSLAIGATLAETFDACGVVGIGVKWPNDLYWSQRKLAGLLIDVVAKPGEITHCVIGIGINVHIPSADRETGSPDTGLNALDQPWVDLAATGWQPLSRSHLAALLLSRVLQAVRCFEVAGLAPFLAAWRRWDVLDGRSLTVQLPDGRTIQGKGAGIHDDGTLRIASGRQIIPIVSGQVRINPDAGSYS